MHAGHWVISMAVIAGFGAGLGACQKASTRLDWRQSAFGRDADRICNAMTQSGADQEPEGTRQLHIAQWLGRNLESQEGRDFLAKVGVLAGRDKVAVFDKLAADHGLGGCPTARLWDK